MQTLDVVNRMLGTMGQLPITSLNTPHRYINACTLALTSTQEALLSPGWWFNSSVADLTPQADTGHVFLANDVLSFEPLDTEPHFVQRGRKLFDMRTDSDVFTANVAGTLVRNIAFEDIPATVAEYVASEAILRFQQEYDGDSAKTRRLEDARTAARILANADETRHVKANILLNNTRLQRLKQRMGRRPR